jgi:creatinine amidohydrolase
MKGPDVGKSGAEWSGVGTCSWCSWLSVVGRRTKLALHLNMLTDTEVLLRKHTRREFRQRMQSGQIKACILPIAAVEQHLEHLAMEHDWRSARHIAIAVAERLRPEVLVAEGLMAGISEHHMRHPGTLSLRPGTFLAVVADLIDSVVRAGFKNVLVLNGHGGNVAPCKGVWDQFQRLYPVNLEFLSYWDVLTHADAKELLQGGHRLPEDLPGHAQEFETSFALAAFPENVRKAACGDQADPLPALASKKTGELVIERVVERVTEFLKQMITGQRTTPTPPYHP